ncbi:MAG TPA: diacylglycerol kinase family protein, partial [Bacillota bacterium]
MNGRGVVILNPVAAHGRVRRRWPRIDEALRSVTGNAPTVWVSQAPGHAVDLAERAVHEGYDWVAACGGDGTVHEVVNGLCRAADGQLADGRPPYLVVLPAGTGNDFARSLGIPRHPLQAIASYRNGSVGTVDVGRVSGRFFANVGGAGFDAEVAAEVNRSGKRMSGALPYV